MINKLTLKPNIEDLLGRAGVKGLNLYVKLNLKSVLSCKFLLELNFFMLFQDINYELILPGVKCSVYLHTKVLFSLFTHQFRPTFPLYLYRL